MRKIRAMSAIATAFTAVVLAAPSASATVSQPVPKATGSIAMSSPMQYASFNAFDYGATGDRGTVTYTNFDFPFAHTGVWLIGSGPYTLDVELDGQWLHTMNIDTVRPTSPTSTSFAGHGAYNGGGYEWTVTGSISGSNVSFAITYTTGLPGYVFTATGTIAGDGSMAGTATDTLSRSSSWTLPAGTAHEVFSYSAAITNVVVTGDSATFEFPAALLGVVVDVKVTDGGSPGMGNDTWSHGVGFPLLPYTITSGNLVVHS